MDYCVSAPYQYNGARNKDLSEYKLTFDDKKNKVDKLCEFLTFDDADVPNKRVNIVYANGFNEKHHKIFSRLHDNLYVCLTRTNDITYVERMRELGIKYYFDSNFPAYNNTTLDMLVNLGVSDMYVVDDLCYNIDNVSKQCYDLGIRLRCVLNRIPSTSIYKKTDPKSVIFRPEDIDLLNQYYDTFEFDCGPTSGYDWHKFNVLMRVFFEQKYWYGDLSEINDDLGFTAYNPTLLKEYFRFKYNCRRKCSTDQDSCHRCENYLDISKMLYDRRAQINDKEL